MSDELFLLRMRVELYFKENTSAFVFNGTFHIYDTKSVDANKQHMKVLMKGLYEMVQLDLLLNVNDIEYNLLIDKVMYFKDEHKKKGVTKEKNHSSRKIIFSKKERSL